MKLVIVVAEFNREVMDVMLASAEEEARSIGAECEVIRVPGAYEVPLPLAVALEREDVDGAVVLGFIERGETLHGEVMGHVVHTAAMDLSIATRKPVGLGIIGPGANETQAHARKDAYARAAVRAALAGLHAAEQARARRAK